ncbi:MAG: DUF3467 domain-containing protein [Candidatus Wallbacteria bacterium HGW-Wallbacteria-1]|jgi:hypothetical protein|uniref:DUF3467 domain-containing protein n=1 Tax=Candidatus Wallbacteria bacterium HGW-Wallbacteria-1 TaxID=2013854 RepID=A0A2N1PRQ8_9BACT|nr:MAG: DUF3467 domain-containing protein [Candidatus Wallbacteria bacterium HGW-Wallbacteria-1]
MTTKSININLELPQDIASGVYSNFQTITFSPTEFVLDFARIVPNAPSGKVLARVITHPAHAKALVEHLKSAVQAFEEKYGPIAIATENHGSGSIGFRAVPREVAEADI